MAKTGGTKLIANNKKARHDYFVENTIRPASSSFGTDSKIYEAGTLQYQGSLYQH